MKKDMSLLDNVFVVLFGVLLAFAITEKNLSDVFRGAVIVLVTIVVSFLTIGINKPSRKERIFYYVVCTVVGFFGSFLIFVWDIPDGVSIFFVWSLPMSTMVWAVAREITIVYILEKNEKPITQAANKKTVRKSSQKTTK